MFGSFIPNNPKTDHKVQFNTVAKVNGKGILLADLVCNTVCNAARGDPNMATQNNTATFPTTDAGSDKGDKYTNPKVPATTAKLTRTCCRKDPGKVDDLEGA